MDKDEELERAIFKVNKEIKAINEYDKKSNDDSVDLSAEEDGEKVIDAERAQKILDAHYREGIDEGNDFYSLDK